MTVASNAADAIAHHVTLEIEALDRLYCNVYQPLLQTPGGVAGFFCGHRRQQVASSALMAPMTRAFVRGIERFAASEGVDLVPFRKGERKDDRTQDYLRRWPGGEGLLYIGKSQEKSRVPRTRGETDPLTGVRRASLYFSTAMVNNYYFYFVDGDCGPCFLKFCSYFPFTARLCLNGHEYAKRQLLRRGIEFEALDNGIRSCADPAALQAICRELGAERIDALLRKWLARLPHPFEAADREAGYRYSVSILQAEMALTQVFDRPLQGRQFFEEVIRENLDRGRPEFVQLVFGRRVTSRTPSRFRTRVLTAGVEPSLHFDYKHSRIKQYFKLGRALRTETTVNDTGDFAVGRLLRNLEKIKAIGFQANRRLLRVQRLSHDPMVGADRFERLHAPQKAGRQRAPGLRFGDRRVQALCAALQAFCFLPHGFRRQDLLERVAPLLGESAASWPPGRASYDLRRLRLRGLIERLPRTHRYRVTRKGRRIATCFHRVYARVLRPGLYRWRSPRTRPILRLRPACWIAWTRRSIDSGRANASPPKLDSKKQPSGCTSSLAAQSRRVASSWKTASVSPGIPVSPQEPSRRQPW